MSAAEGLPKIILQLLIHPVQGDPGLLRVIVPPGFSALSQDGRKSMCVDVVCSFCEELHSIETLSRCKRHAEYQTGKTVEVVEADRDPQDVVDPIA